MVCSRTKTTLYELNKILKCLNKIRVQIDFSETRAKRLHVVAKTLCYFQNLVFDDYELFVLNNRDRNRIELS